MITSTIYSLLKLYVKLALKFYFKRYKVVKQSNIPEGPVIFVANHQNAFLDALVLTCAINRNPFFLARASAFHKSWVARILKTLKIIPIYRIRDGFSNVKKNNDVIENCVKILGSGSDLMIFPEGDLDNKYRLRSLKKGVSRIVTEACKIHDFKLDLKIVPVGIQYEKYDGIGSSVLVNIGQPLNLNNFQDQYTRDPAMATQLLLENISDAIRGLIIDIPSDLPYDEILERWQKTRTRFPDLLERLRNDKKLIEYIAKDRSKSDNDKPQQNSISISKLIHIIFYTPSRINFMIAVFFISYYLNTRLKEPMWKGSMRFVLWIFPGMFILIIQTLVLYLLTLQIVLAFLYFLASILIAGVAIKTKPEDQ